ncbi:pentatricopeptide repeat-containing protein At1g62350-like [Phragmites australis]|uniref:pentatricopeptide repeat-containing protein At1g62350-like n=1 Tax=Phragmites australis TaxID=29695 RepID=UPI002D790C7F|nr:pentatricopeptide repeat-containing protein At1g62350-like [Phragmites australis]
MALLGDMFVVFEEIRKEHWYKPRLLWYVNLITVLASKGLRSEVDRACSYLKREQLEPDTDGFNLLLKTLLDAGFTQLTMDCFRLMKLWDSDPDRITYRTLIKGLESLGKMDLSPDVRLEAENEYGSLDFLDEVETDKACISSSFLFNQLELQLQSFE